MAFRSAACKSISALAARIASKMSDRPACCVNVGLLAIIASISALVG
ncbi:unnamed protein product, partial [Rotaria sp. Silwood1]